MVQIIGILRLLIANKEQIVQFLEMIKAIFAAKTLIGEDGADNVITAERSDYPEVAKAVQAAGLEWTEFVRLIVENLDDLKALIQVIVELVQKLKS